MQLNQLLGRAVRAVTGILVVLGSTGVATAAGDITYTNLADDPGAGLDYERGKSASFAVIEALRQQSLQEPINPDIFPFTPHNSQGQPGVAIFDFDRDGDLDIYVTNGPGVPNNLYSNQMIETGMVSFVDVGLAAAVDATDQDGMGVCYGDIDNDGYHDLLVLGRDEPNRLFKNLGNGTFSELANSGLEVGSLASSSCAMGDIDNDGLLDIFVGNAWNQDTLVGCVIEPFADNQHNQLYLNQGNGTFSDVSASSGIMDLGGLPPENAGSATITWAVVMVDIDFDGDIDIIQGDDQCALAEERFGGVDRGYVHVLLNDGTGNFSDIPIILNDQASSSWMGLAVGDLNCDGNLDLFGSNFGDYGDEIAAPFPYTLGDQTTRWLLGNGDGTFTDPAVGNIASVFGWGTGIFDHDNDGDQDVVYHGGIDLNFFMLTDNPGVLLDNQNCSASFEVDIDIFPADHIRRNVQGVATGDLDGNGFVDVVAASSFDTPPSLPIVLSPSEYPNTLYGPIFDPIAGAAFSFDPTPDGFVWNGVDLLPGSLSVEMNNGNDNNWAQATPMGTVGITSLGQVNRDGIGAVFEFTPRQFVPGQGLVEGHTVLVPILGGSSFASQNSLDAIFGLGSAKRGVLDVIWPNGVRNRLYNVKKFEKIVVPEIPCSFDAGWNSFLDYAYCVTTSLGELKDAGVLTPPQKARFLSSAIIAFFDQ